MIDLIERAAHLIDAELGNPTAVRALVLGFGASIGGTQLVKFASQLTRMPDREFRVAVRLFAFLSGFVWTWGFWPQAGWNGVAIGIVVGLLAPLLYTTTARVLVHRWPWLDGKISARPEA